MTSKKENTCHLELNEDRTPKWCGDFILYDHTMGTKEVQAVEKVLAELSKMGYEDEHIRVQLTHKPIGDPNKYDPLDLYGAFGWKVYFKDGDGNVSF